MSLLVRLMNTIGRPQQLCFSKTCIITDPFSIFYWFRHSSLLETHSAKLHWSSTSWIHLVLEKTIVHNSKFVVVVHATTYHFYWKHQQTPNMRAHHQLLSATGFREHSVNIQGTFSDHSVNIQGTFSEHSVNIQRTFSEHSVNIQ
jgi:hypothetical protein